MSCLDDCLEALRAHKSGDWDLAHNLAQRHEGEACADWIHGMLHREEGDHGNAAYWYRRAGKSFDGSIAEERERILTYLLGLKKNGQSS